MTHRPDGTIRCVETDEEILRAFPVMRQLRTHLVEAEFLPTIRRQVAGGYHLVCLESAKQVRGVAGYRFIDNLANTRILYVDDLVTDAGERSHGHGKRLLEWLAECARRNDCHAVELDSGVQRHAAHHFYLMNRMIISSHHFRLPL